MSHTIVGTGSALPSERILNRDLAAGLGISQAWIENKTGILERRMAGPGEATSDLAVAAARRALCNAGMEAREIDLIIVGTSTPDHPQPATACMVQRGLGAVNAAAFDVNAVCSSFVYALDVASSLLSAGTGVRRALVIGADIYTRQLDYGDRRTCVLFGDGAGAVVLAAAAPRQGILASKLISDGRLSDLVMVPAGGSRLPPSAQTLADGAGFFTMRGRDVREYVEEVFPRLLNDLLGQAGYTLADLDVVVPHQANGVMVNACARAAGLPVAKLRSTYRWYGNTGAASIPVTLDDAVLRKQIEPGALVALIGFGGGMTAGGLLIRWSGNTRVCEEVEVGA
jgi:3-oxoacyl-[acyl-carrier-protein] synthase-3